MLAFTLRESWKESNRISIIAIRGRRGKKKASLASSLPCALWSKWLFRIFMEATKAALLPPPPPLLLAGRESGKILLHSVRVLRLKIVGE